MKRDLSHYLSLRYRYELEADPEEGGFFASHPELPGCFAQGESANEAVEELDEAREAWLEARWEEGLPIPEPRQVEELSGKLTLRIPPSMHRALTEQSTREQTSLNTWINLVLAERLAGIEERSRLAVELKQGLEHLESRLSRIESRLGSPRSAAPTSVRAGA